MIASLFMWMGYFGTIILENQKTITVDSYALRRVCLSIVFGKSSQQCFVVESSFIMTMPLQHTWTNVRLEFLTLSGVELLGHPPYSLDLESYEFF